MGLLDSARNFYYGLEEKYYDFLDKANDKVPVYEVIDPIDKVFPSFILFAALFLLVAAFAASTAANAFFPSQNNSLAVSVLDSQGNALEGASVTFLAGTQVLSSATTDSFGIAKQQGLKVEDQLEVRAEKQGYLSGAKTVIISELPQGEQITLENEGGAFTTRTVRLLDDLGQPIASIFTLKFRCSNPYAPTISDISLGPADNGTAQVQAPNNCDRLTVDVSNSNRFQELHGKALLSADESIHLSGDEAQDAKIVINVADAEGKPIDGIQVELYKHAELLDNPNVGPIDVKYTSGGRVEFSKAPGDYVAKTYDSAGSYGEKSSGKISAASGQSAAVNLVLSEDVKGQIKVKAVDKSTGSLIAGATVRLFLEPGNDELSSATTGSDGIASANISRDVEYKAIVSAQGYQLGRLSGLRISQTPGQVELEKCTPTKCGSLKVKVVDQDGLPLTHAVVALYNASTNFIAGYNNRTTDINGVAKFFGVSSGNYYAFAFMEGYSGRSDAAPFAGTQAETTQADLTVNMDVGEGTVKVIARDADGKAVPFTTVSIFDSRNNQLVGKGITDSNGVKEFADLKANRKIYIVASKQDEQYFATYTTAKRPIIESSVQEFFVTLEKPILKDNIEIEFLGLYSEGKRAQNAKAGEVYSAKFKLRVPEEKDYDTAGVHIRTGEDVLMEKDDLFLKEVNAAKTSQIRVSRFESDKSGLDEGDYDVTEGDAKWVNLEWNNPSAGVYEVEAEVRVKDSAAVGNKLSMKYRAWGEAEGKRDRFPKDDTITKELYSNTKQEILQVGVVTLCDENFCFTATMADKENGLLETVSDTYNARVFNPYTFQFIITNNSETRIHNNANLRVSNIDESMKFFDYKFTNSETQQTQGIVNGFEFTRLNAGNLGPKNSVRLEAEMTPQKAINGIINIKLVSDQSIVFEKNITIITSSPKELDAQIEPSVYLSGVQNDINATITDKADGTQIEGAIVRLKDKKNNVLDYYRTGKDGVAYLTLPGQKPGEKLKLEIEKINYNVKVVELAVSDKLLEINPSTLGIALNTKNRQQSEEKLSVRNAAPYDLKIKAITFSGNFKKLIDTARVRNWLETSYRGMTIKAGEKQEIVLKTFLSQDALGLSSRANLDGELVIDASNFGQEWVFKVPAKIAIGLGDEVDDPTCLIVTKSEWVTSTSGTPKRTEFQVQNNCTVKKKPVAIQNLEAKVNWKTNQLGEYVLNIGADEITLRPGYYRLLLGTLQPEQTLTAILSFTPFGGVNGTGEADVVIQAANPLDGEDQVLQNTIKTKITSINLGQCITYDKERLVVNQNEAGTITVNANQTCGEPVEFKIESELHTTPKEGFTLQPGSSQAIQIFAEKNYPGQYPLFLSPKFSSEKKEQLVKNLRVIVNAPGCWQLSKYEFDVYDDDDRIDPFDGFDTANLANNCVEKPVQVKVNAKDWLDAAQDGLFWGLTSMGLVMLTNHFDTKDGVNWLGTSDLKANALAQATVNGNNYYMDAVGKWRYGKTDELVQDPGLLKQIGYRAQAIDNKAPAGRGSGPAVTRIPPSTGQAPPADARNIGLPPGAIVPAPPEVKSYNLTTVDGVGYYTDGTGWYTGDFVPVTDEETLDRLNSQPKPVPVQQPEAKPSGLQQEQFRTVDGADYHTDASGTWYDSSDAPVTDSAVLGKLGSQGTAQAGTAKASVVPARVAVDEAANALAFGEAQRRQAISGMQPGDYFRAGDKWTLSTDPSSDERIQITDQAQVDLLNKSQMDNAIINSGGITVGTLKVTQEMIDTRIIPEAEKPETPAEVAAEARARRQAEEAAFSGTVPAPSAQAFLPQGSYQKINGSWFALKSDDIASPDKEKVSDPSQIAAIDKAVASTNPNAVRSSIYIGSDVGYLFQPQEVYSRKLGTTDWFNDKTKQFVADKAAKDYLNVAQTVTPLASNSFKVQSGASKVTITITKPVPQQIPRPQNIPGAPGTARVVLAQGPQPIPPIQALAPGYGGSGGGGGIFSSFLGGAGGSLTSKLLGGGGGIVRSLFGTNPWTAGIMGMVVGTIASYAGQEKEVTFTVLQKDSEVQNIKLVQGAAETEQEDKDIKVQTEGLGGKGEAPTAPQAIVKNPDLISQGMETFRVIFTNATGFITSEARPKYSNLKAEGVRHKYKDKVYKKKDFITETGGFLGFFDTPTVNKSRTKLEEEGSTKLEQRYKLEFNSIPPEIEKTQSVALLNCQDGTRVGSTGFDALPKVKFKWNWKDISPEECNEDNANGIYCDATQFSIAILKKADQLAKFVGDNGASFSCPSPLEDNASNNTIGSFDIGIESLATAKKGTEVEVVALIKNTNPGPIETSANLRLAKPNNAGEIACASGLQRLTIPAGGTGEAKCTFRDLVQGFYNAKADITPSVSCTNCEDIAATNSLSKTFFAGQSGLQQCEPYSTARLTDFLKASGIKNDKMIALTKFNALLMVDGYSSDFQHDFDTAQAETFFSAPDAYLNKQNGLGNYFRDTKLFSFDAYSQPDFTLPGPGTYSVTLDITYNDNSWQLFDAKGNPKAKITVKMEKLKGAQPDSPFYYTPLDGLVGENGRVGYGVNFAGDSIVIDNSQQPVRTVEIAGSTPIENGVVQVTKSKSFKSMQVDERGVVAKLSRQGGNPSLLFQPSKATPVILSIEKKSGQDAYAIYEPAIDGDAVDVGQTLTYWNGIGASCRGFNDSVMSQQQFVADTHGLSTRCALVGQNARSKYALEFCGQPKDFGSVFYETVFYTPQDSLSYLQLADVASDSAKLISANVTASKVELNGNTATSRINTLEDVFNLVKDEYMCVSGTNINAEFFWNPKKLFMTIESKEEAALNACITKQKNK